MRKPRAGGSWRPDIERENGRRLIPTDYAEATNRNAHLDTVVLRWILLGKATPANSGPPAIPATADGKEPKALSKQASNGHDADAATCDVVATDATDDATVEETFDATATGLAARKWAGVLQSALEDNAKGYKGRDAAGQLPIFTDLQEALADFLADVMAHETRPLPGETRVNLRKLRGALGRWRKTWDAADIGARQIVYLGMGAGHDDPFSEGARRILAFHETAQAIDTATKAIPEQEYSITRHAQLFDRLAAIYSATRKAENLDQKITYSTLRWSARAFFEAVTSTALLGKYSPKPDTVARGVRCIIREQKKRERAQKGQHS
jgi:hypothetical protein